MSLKARLYEVQKEKAQKAVDELIHHIRKAIERNGGKANEMESQEEAATQGG